MKRCERWGYSRGAAKECACRGEAELAESWWYILDYYGHLGQNEASGLGILVGKRILQ